MLTFKQFCEEKNRFIHGTTVDNVDSIKKNWIQPKTSEYSRNFYGDDIKPTVFVAHQDDTKRAYSSIRGQVASKLNKSPSSVTPEDIKNHGAMIVTRAHDKYSLKRKDDDGGHTDLEGNKDYSDGPIHAEPGDYWTNDDMRPTGVLKGSRLIKHLQKRGINEAWGRDTWEATKKHYRIENRLRKNKLMHPASLASLGALFAATPVKHMLSSGSDPHALALAASGAALAGAASINHFKEIIEIRKKIKASRKRQEEWKASG